ncbi:unnamed protein product, partial [Prorocentrum cordatum]
SHLGSRRRAPPEEARDSLEGRASRSDGARWFQRGQAEQRRGGVRRRPEADGHAGGPAGCRQRHGARGGGRRPRRRGGRPRAGRGVGKPQPPRVVQLQPAGEEFHQDRPVTAAVEGRPRQRLGRGAAPEGPLGRRGPRRGPAGEGPEARRPPVQRRGPLEGTRRRQKLPTVDDSTSVSRAPAGHRRSLAGSRRRFSSNALGIEGPPQPLLVACTALFLRLFSPPSSPRDTREFMQDPCAL